MSENAALLLADARRLARESAERHEAARRALAEAEAAEQARLEGLGLAEPNENGYTYAAVRLDNGAEVMAKRSPNGVWWWETCTCDSNESCRRWGDWDSLLACLKPYRVVPLRADR